MTPLRLGARAVTAALVLAAPVAGAASVSLTEAVARVRASHPSVSAAEDAVRAAQGGRRQAGLPVANPVLSVELADARRLAGAEVARRRVAAGDVARFAVNLASVEPRGRRRRSRSPRARTARSSFTWGGAASRHALYAHGGPGA